MAKDASDPSTSSLGGNANAAGRRSTAREDLSRAKGGGNETAIAHRQLHRFLFVVSSCAQRRYDAARPRERADAELEMVACCISWTRQFRDRQRNQRAPSKRADESAGRNRANVRPEQKPRLRTGDGVSDRSRKLVRETRSDRSRRRTHFRTGPDE